MLDWEFMRYVWDIPETPYQRRCRQLREYIKSKLSFKRLSVSRSYVGNRTFYTIDMHSKIANSCDLGKLFEGVSSGLVYYDKNNDVKHIVYLVDEDELHDKYLKDGDLVFEESFDFIYAFCKGYEDQIKKQSDKIVAVMCDNESDLCLIYIKEWASPTGVLSDLKVKNNDEYWSHYHNMMVINIEYVELEE